MLDNNSPQGEGGLGDEGGLGRGTRNRRACDLVLAPGKRTAADGGTGAGGAEGAPGKIQIPLRNIDMACGSARGSA